MASIRNPDSLEESRSIQFPFCHHLLRAPTLAGRFPVPILGHDTHGVAVCNQVRSFDLDAREKAGSARFIETLDPSTMAEIVNRVVSVIDPAQN